MQSDIGRPFIAHRANGFQIGRCVIAAQAFIFHVPNVQPGCTRKVIRVEFTGNSTTHLASEAIAIEHIGARFLRNRTLGLEFRGRLK